MLFCEKNETCFHRHFVQKGQHFGLCCLREVNNWVAHEVVCVLSEDVIVFLRSSYDLYSHQTDLRW